jgi:hypothetical protein
MGARQPGKRLLHSSFFGVFLQRWQLNAAHSPVMCHLFDGVRINGFRSSSARHASSFSPQGSLVFKLTDCSIPLQISERWRN